MAISAFSVWLEEQFRRTPGVRAKDIAGDAEISEGYLSALRSGKNERPSSGRAKAIAFAFATRRRMTDPEIAALADEAERVISLDRPPSDDARLSEGAFLRAPAKGFVRVGEPEPGLWPVLRDATLRREARR